MTLHDRTDLVYGIVREVASKEGVSPENLPPLGETIDTDALASLVCASEADLTVEFAYLDYRIVVDADGSTRVLDSEREDADLR